MSATSGRIAFDSVPVKTKGWVRFFKGLMVGDPPRPDRPTLPKGFIQHQHQVLILKDGDRRRRSMHDRRDILCKKFVQYMANLRKCS